MQTYSLLDSGQGAKLEQIGDYLLVRPAFNAIWPRRLTDQEWNKADAVFRGDLSGGNGRWIGKSSMPEFFPVQYGGLEWQCKLQDYGHVGIFFEQLENWQWLRKQVQAGGKTLNLFAYTGGSTLAMASKAFVTHVDAASNVVKWARTQADSNGAGQDTVRWITEDALRFVNREVKRKKHYDGIVMDPPSFGRGGKGATWKIERDLMSLLLSVRQLLPSKGGFVLLSAHSHGFTGAVLANCLKEVLPKGKITKGSMRLSDAYDREVPSGVFARWVGA